MRDEYDTNVMMDEMKRLREELRVASMMIDELRDRVDRVEQNTSSSAVPSSETESGIGVSPDEAGIVNQAFKVVWIQRDGSDGGDYKVFAPDGCLYYGGKKVSISVDDDNLASVDGIDGEIGGTIYCNVTKIGSGSEASYSATFSVNDDAGSAISFKVANVPSDAESPLSQYALGTVSFCGCDDGGGGGGEVEVDDVSVENTSQRKLAIKNYHNNATEQYSLAEAITTNYGTDNESIERGSASGVISDVKYRQLGRFVSGEDSNVHFTSDNNGTVSVDVYWV